MLIWIGITVGGLVGAYIPVLWGDHNFLGAASILFSAVGSLAGLWLGYKIGKSVEG